MPLEPCLDASLRAHQASFGLTSLETEMVGHNKLLGTSASLLVTSALLVVTMFAIRSKNNSLHHNDFELDLRHPKFGEMRFWNLVTRKASSNKKLLVAPGILVTRALLPVTRSY